MIEKCLGEQIVGLDFYLKDALFETDRKIRLQKDENEEDILDMEYFSSIDLSLPKSEINVLDGIGNGGKFSTTVEEKNRTFSFSTKFKSNSVTPFNVERIEKLVNWFSYNSEEKLYLCIHIKDMLETYRIEVRPSVSGEKYKNLAISEDISLKLVSEKPFFESVRSKRILDNIANNYPIIFSVNGFETFPNIKLTLNKNVTSIIMYSTSNYGFEIRGDIRAGVIDIDTEKAKIFYNGVESPNLIYRGSFFSLK